MACRKFSIKTAWIIFMFLWIYFPDFFITELYGDVFTDSAFSQFQILISTPDSYLVSSRVIVNIRCVMPALMVGFKTWDYYKT